MAEAETELKNKHRQTLIQAQSVRPDTANICLVGALVVWGE